MFRFVFKVVLVLMPVSGFCQGALLTLDQALDIAMRDNLALASAELEVSAAQNDVAALKTRRYPSMDLRGGVTDNLTEQEYNFDQGVWGTFPGTGPIPSQDVTITSAKGTTQFLSAGITQPLSQQYRLSLSIQQGEVKEEMAEETVRLTRQDLARVVKQQYFQIVQTQSDLRTTEESIAFYESLDELVTQYVAQQIALEYELLEVQARLARKRWLADTQTNRLKTEKERMNDSLARPLDMPFSVADLPDPASRPTNPDEAILLAMQQRPDVLESRLMIESEELGYDIKKAEYIPDLDIQIRYAKLYGYNLIPDAEAYVGLHAKWEIYDWGRKRKELAGKSSMIRKANNHAREIENRVAIEVDSSFRSMEQSEQSVRVAKLSQAAAREKVRVLTNQYRQQSVLLQDVLDAETELARANNDYNRAVLSVWEAQAELEHATGTT